MAVDDDESLPPESDGAKQVPSKKKRSELRNFISWGQPEQLDDCLGERRAQARSNRLRPGLSIKGKPRASDDVLSSNDLVRNGNWPRHGVLFRTCYLLVPAGAMKHVVGEHVEAMPEVGKRQMELHFGSYRIPLRYRGTTVHQRYQSREEGFLWQRTEPRSPLTQFHLLQEDEHILPQNASSLIDSYVFEAVPVAPATWFHSSRMFNGPNSRTVEPKIVHRATQKSVTLGTLYDDDLDYTMFGSSDEQVLCVERGRFSIGIFFPYLYSIPRKHCRPSSTEAPAAPTTTSSTHPLIAALASLPTALLLNTVLPFLRTSATKRLARVVKHDDGASADLYLQLQKSLAMSIGCPPQRSLDPFPDCFSDDFPVRKLAQFRRTWVLLPEWFAQGWRNNSLRRTLSRREWRWDEEEEDGRGHRPRPGTLAVNNETRDVAEYYGLHAFQYSSATAPTNPSAHCDAPPTFPVHVWRLESDAVPKAMQVGNFYAPCWTLSFQFSSEYKNDPAVVWSLPLREFRIRESPWLNRAATAAASTTQNGESLLCVTNWPRDTSIPRTPVVIAEFSRSPNPDELLASPKLTKKARRATANA
jgi:hypothetical protein